MSASLSAWWPTTKHQGVRPPVHLLPQLAQALCVDVLLGLAEQRLPKKTSTHRLERRRLEIEKLDPKAKRQITQLLDSFIEGEKLKRRMNARTGSRASAQSAQEV